MPLISDQRQQCDLLVCVYCGGSFRSSEDTDSWLNSQLTLAYPDDTWQPSHPVTLPPTTKHATHASISPFLRH